MTATTFDRRGSDSVLVPLLPSLQPSLDFRDAGLANSRGRRVVDFMKPTTPRTAGLS